MFQQKVKQDHISQSSFSSFSIKKCLFFFQVSLFLFLRFSYDFIFLKIGQSCFIFSNNCLVAERKLCKHVKQSSPINPGSRCSWKNDKFQAYCGWYIRISKTKQVIFIDLYYAKVLLRSATQQNVQKTEKMTQPCWVTLHQNVLLDLSWDVKHVSPFGTLIQLKKIFYWQLCYLCQLTNRYKILNL